MHTCTHSHMHTCTLSHRCVLDMGNWWERSFDWRGTGPPFKYTKRLVSSTVANTYVHETQYITSTLYMYIWIDLSSYKYKEILFFSYMYITAYLLFVAKQLWFQRICTYIHMYALAYGGQVGGECMSALRAGSFLDRVV